MSIPYSKDFVKLYSSQQNIAQATVMLVLIQYHTKHTDYVCFNFFHRFLNANP